MSSFGKFMAISALVIVLVVVGASIVIALNPSINTAWFFAVLLVLTVAFGLGGKYVAGRRS